MLTSQELYVSNSGSDTTGDGTAAKPFATIQKAIEALPKNLNGHQNSIHVDAGTYEGFNIGGFYGGSCGNLSGISILGNNSDEGETVITGGVEVASCEVPVELDYLNITGEENGCNISVLCCGGFVKLNGCKSTGVATETGIWIHKTMASIYNCEVSDKANCAIRIDGSLVFAAFITGSGNTTCFCVGSRYSAMPALLIGCQHNIDGSTKYLREYGGIVLADGALS